MKKGTEGKTYISVRGPILSRNWICTISSVDQPPLIVFKMDNGY